MSTPEKPRPPFEPGHTSGAPYRELPSVTNRPAVGATPRPSLDDTLARIEQALAEPVPNPPCLRCARQALLGEPHCAAHKRIPREGIEELGPVTREGKSAELLPELEQKLLDAAVRDVTGPEEPADFATINEQRAKVGLPPIPAPLFAPIPPARPGWLARALHRLFGSDT